MEIQEFSLNALPALSRYPESLSALLHSEPELEIRSQFDEENQTQKRSKIQPPTKTKFKQQRKKQAAHNVIEERYRNNINSKIEALRDSVPSLRIAAKGNSSCEENAESDSEYLASEETG